MPRVVVPWLLCMMLLVGVMPVHAAPEGATMRASLAADGRMRSYLVHLPPGYDGTTPMPLVMILDGRGGDGAGIENLSRFDAVADTNSLIAVYPDGVLRSWANGNGVSPADRMGVNDVAFIAALLDRLERDYAVDVARMYVVGISNGGYMAERLVCDLPDRFAAVGVVSAAVSGALEQSCPAGPTIPVVLMHGTNDPIVPASGVMVAGQGGAILSTVDSVAFWVNRNSCTTPPAITEIPDMVSDGTHIHKEVYTGCRDGADVTYYEMQGAGHIWPGGPQYLPVRIIGKTTKNLDGSAALWDFFVTHPKQPAQVSPA